MPGQQRGPVDEERAGDVDGEVPHERRGVELEAGPGCRAQSKDRKGQEEGGGEDRGPRDFADGHARLVLLIIMFMSLQRLMPDPLNL